MGLKCWGFYSNVDDTTLKARAVSGQSVFVKKDEEKFYGEDKKKGHRFVRSLSVTGSFI